MRHLDWFWTGVVPWLTGVAIGLALIHYEVVG